MARPSTLTSEASSNETDSNLLPKSLKLNAKDLPSLRRLGKGLSGFIYETTWHGNRYARKDFPLGSVKHVIFEKEASILLVLDHPNIVKCFGYAIGRSSCSLVQEYMDDDLQSTMRRRIEAHRKRNSTSTSRSRVLAVDEIKSLLHSKVLKERDTKRVHEAGKSRLLGSGSTIPFDIPEVQDIISQIAIGMKYLHDHQVVHGDLKPKNVLVCSESGKMKVKVADFGLIETKKRIKLVSKRTQHYETLMWKAPELLEELLGPLTEDSDDCFTDSDTEEDKRFGSHDDDNFNFLATADVYSFGLTCSHILGGKLLFPDLSLTQLRTQRMHGFMPELPSACPENFKFIIGLCLRTDHRRRPTFSSLCTLIAQDPLLYIPKLTDLREGLTASLEQMEPISQVPKALKIIENVQKISGDVWVNKHQCKRVADRFAAIGKGLSDWIFCGDSDASSNMDYPAFDELLTVLRKGEVLVSKYIQLTGIKSVLTWTDNREAFKEIHEELDTMKGKFLFESFDGHFETSSGIKRSVILAQDADKDLEEMQDLPNIKKSLQSSKKPEAMDLEKVVKVVLEKSEAKSELQEESDDLPSYLKIDLSTIGIKDYVRKQEILSKQESQETHGWAIVCEGSWLGCEFAVKVFKSDKSNWNKDQLLKEVRALMELRHPHIIRFIGFAEDAKLCSLLMEMMPERDLRHFMKQRPGRRSFTRSQELDIITQIAKGMLYLHTQGYVHGDLKCSNILVKKYEDYIEVKIGDLRYAQKLESAGGSSEINLVRRPRWTPLEALDNYGGAKPTDDLLKQADVYSFAMTCYEVVSGKYPFHGVRDDALLAQIKEGVRPELPGELDSGLKGLIESCWDNDPNKRPVFEDICHVLNYIRSSMPTVTIISSGIATVRNALKQIPKIQGFLKKWPRGDQGRVEAGESSTESSAKAATTTWAGNMAKGRGTEEAAYADAIKIPECLKIKPESLKIVRRVGSGSFSKVYEATWLGCTFAVKRIKKFDSAESISALQREVDFLIQLRHPYIIQIVGFSVDEKERCLIVMEYMDGSLRDLINFRMKKKATVTKNDSSQLVLPFEFHEAVGIIKKIALGMAFLHSRGVAHMDLNCSNVLCEEHNGFMDVKIADFGVSQYIATSGMDGLLGIGRGYWRAPEIFPTAANRSRTYGVDLKATDVYSFAMTCYEVLTGGTPFLEEFGNRTAEYDQVVKGRRPRLPYGLDADLKELIAECWDTDPNQRPDFAQICARLVAFPH